MPIYEYEHTEVSRVCPMKFEVNRPLNASPLTVCPVCKKTVRRVYGGFYMPNHLQKVNVRAAKEAGFTVLKKSSKGEYEVHKPDRGI